VADQSSGTRGDGDRPGLKRARKGRPPRGGDAPPKRDQIIAAARALLRDQPPGRISRTDVARAAAVDLRLIAYYFDDEEGLFTAVASQISRDMHARVDAMIAKGLTGRDRLEAIIRLYLDHFIADPHQPELFVDLILHKNSAAARELRSALVRRAFREVEGALKEAEAEGHRHRNPQLVYIALFGMLSFFMNGHALLGELDYPDRPIEKTAADYAALVLDLLG
jgi:AcrR family transcriptional regulator